MLIDVREPTSIKSKFSKAEIKQLQVGDFVIGNVIIERKTATDFIMSIIDQRYLTQIPNLGSNAIIAVIGQFSKGINEVKQHSRMTGMQIQNICLGALVSICIKYKINVLCFENESQFIYFLQRLNEKINEKGQIQDLVPIRKYKPNYSLGVLCSIPGVSVGRAQKIMKNYGSVLDALNDYEKWVSIKGIGPGIIKKVKDVLGDKK